MESVIRKRAKSRPSAAASGLPMARRRNTRLALRTRPSGDTIAAMMPAEPSRSPVWPSISAWTWLARSSACTPMKRQTSDSSPTRWTRADTGAPNT